MLTKNKSKKACLLRRGISLSALIVIFLAVCLGIGNSLLKQRAVSWIEKVTGLPASIEKVSVLGPASLQFQNVEVKNPKGFFLPRFAQFRSVRVTFSLKGLLVNAPRIKDLSISDAEFFIEKNLEQKPNISFLKIFDASKPAAPILIDHADISLQHLHYQEPYGDMTRNFSISLDQKESLGAVKTDNILIIKILEALFKTQPIPSELIHTGEEFNKRIMP